MCGRSFWVDCVTWRSTAALTHTHKKLNHPVTSSAVTLLSTTRQPPNLTTSATLRMSALYFGVHKACIPALLPRMNCAAPSSSESSAVIPNRAVRIGEFRTPSPVMDPSTSRPLSPLKLFCLPVCRQRAAAALPASERRDSNSEKVSPQFPISPRG